MLWISAILISTSIYAKELPKLLTKNALDSIRFMTSDGRFTYVQKRPGVLGLVSSFRSTDFQSESHSSTFLMQDSRFKKRLVIEAIPDAHQEFNLVKESKIMVVDWGNTKTREVGTGKSPKLHLNDEWITYWIPSERTITLKNLLTDKSYPIKLSPKLNPFFTPEVEMISSDSLIYTLVNEKGYASLNSYNLITKKNLVIYQSNQTSTHLDTCQHEGYLAFGEFPYDDTPKGSSIMKIKLAGAVTLSGFETIYSSSDADIGNMVCTDKDIYFIKTMDNNRKLNIKTTEVVKLELASSKVQVMTSLSSVTQLISMDGKIMAPFRGDYFVMEGEYNFTEDKLKPRNSPSTDEELPLDI